MDVTSGSSFATATYQQRSAGRMYECEQLVAELGGLHPILERDQARIEAIAARLRQLADEQRRDTPSDSSYAAHKVSLWRRLDAQARRAEDLHETGGWAQQALDAELDGLISRGLRVTDYDTALMTLSGQPLSERPRTSSPRAGFKVETAKVAIVAIGLAVAVAVFLLFLHHRYIIGFVILIYAIRILARIGPRYFPSLGDLEPPPSPDPDQICPGYLPYRTVVDAEIAAVNADFEALKTESTSSSDYHTAIADLMSFRAKLNRINPPPDVRNVHEVELALIESWIGVVQAALNGTVGRKDLERADDLAEQANAMMHELAARCLAG